MRRDSAVHVLVNSQESRLVADIGDLIVVQIVESFDKRRRPAKCTDEPRLIVRHVKGVLPNAALKSLIGIVLQRADRVGVGVDVRALEWVLISPCLVQELGLKEACEAIIGTIEQIACLVVFE